MSNRKFKGPASPPPFSIALQMFFSSFHTVCCDFFKSLPVDIHHLSIELTNILSHGKRLSIYSKENLSEERYSADQWLSMLANGTCWLGIGPRLFRRVLMMWLTGGKAIGVFWPRFDLISSSLFFFSETTDYCSGVTCAPHAPLSMLQPRDVHMLIRLS